MDRISIEDLKALDASGHAQREAELRRRRDETHEALRRQVECSLFGVTALLSIAAIDLGVTGIPAEIPLSNGHGPLAGLVARRHEGRSGADEPGRSERTVWRIDGPDEALSSVGPYAHVSRAGAIKNVLAALGLDPAGGAYDAVERQGSWDPARVDLFDRTTRAGGRVEPWVLAAGLGYGRTLLRELAGKTAGYDEVRELARAVAALGVDPARDLPERVEHPVFRAIKADDKDAVVAILSSGFTPRRPSLDGLTPFLDAAAHGHLDIAEMLARECDPDETNPDGENALHLLARAIGERDVPDPARAVARIEALGTSVTATDRNGRTPGDALLVTAGDLQRCLDQGAGGVDAAHVEAVHAAAQALKDKGDYLSGRSFGR